MKHITLFLLIATAAFSPIGSIQAVQADTQFNVCATVQPCDEEGNVLVQFASGPCFETYVARCQNEAVGKMAEKINKSDEIIATLKKQNAALKKKLRKLLRAK